MYAHIVVATHFSHPVLEPTERARWLWQRLRHHLPEVLAATLMSTQVHLALLSRLVVGARAMLARSLGAFSRRYRLGRVWQPIRSAAEIPTPQHAHRLVRYLHLNPCRRSRIAGRLAGLVDDPRRWAWSTHRDVVGAIAEPWVAPGGARRRAR